MIRREYLNLKQQSFAPTPHVTATDVCWMAHKLLDGSETQLDCVEATGKYGVVTLTIHTGKGPVFDCAALRLLQEYWLYDLMPVNTEIRFVALSDESDMYAKELLI